MSSGKDMRPFTASLPMALLSAREAAMSFFRPLLGEHDLTEQQWRVLRALSSARAPIDAGELAATTCLLPPSLSRILDNLATRGFVSREVDPDDQRRALLALTDSGAATVRQIAPESERRYGEIESVFGAERLDRLLGELHDFVEAVERRTHEAEVDDDAA